MFYSSLFSKTPSYYVTSSRSKRLLTISSEIGMRVMRKIGHIPRSLSKPYNVDNSGHQYVLKVSLLLRQLKLNLLELEVNL